jgi:toxin ParE1/3/4
VKVRFTRQARSDLKSILQYIRERNPTGARHVGQEFRRSLGIIAQYPFGAEATDDPELRVKTVAKYPYRIFYRVVGDEIEVWHVRHAARRPWEGAKAKSKS